MADPSAWIQEDCYPSGFQWADPSKIRVGQVFCLLDHWRARHDAGLDPLIWNSSCDVLANANHPREDVGSKRRESISDEEDFAAELDNIPEDSSESSSSQSSSPSPSPSPSPQKGSGHQPSAAEESEKATCHRSISLAPPSSAQNSGRTLIQFRCVLSFTGCAPVTLDDRHGADPVILESAHTEPEHGMLCTNKHGKILCTNVL
jgi:hypothetical protein